MRISDPNLNRTRKALEDVENGKTLQVPEHLKNIRVSAQAAATHADSDTQYVYPHDHPGAVVAQQYLPEEAADDILYRPHRLGEEDELAKRLEEIDRALGKKERGE